MRYAAIVATAAGLAITHGAAAQTAVWSNPAGGEWGDPANWLGGVLPPANGIVRFDLDAEYTVHAPSYYEGRRLVVDRSRLLLLAPPNANLPYLGWSESEAVNPPAVLVGETPGRSASLTTDLTLSGGSFVVGARGGGALHIDITAESDHDRLEVTGVATLGGTLRANFIGGFEPSWGDRYTVLTAGAIDGEFETIDAPAPAPGLEWLVEYGDTSATLTVHHQTDLSRDYRVDALDIALLLGQWGRRQHPWYLSGNSVVDGADLGILLGDWGLAAH